MLNVVSIPSQSPKTEPLRSPILALNTGRAAIPVPSTASGAVSVAAPDESGRGSSVGRGIEPCSIGAYRGASYGSIDNLSVLGSSCGGVEATGWFALGSRGCGERLGEVGVEER